MGTQTETNLRRHHEFRVEAYRRVGGIFLFKSEITVRISFYWLLRLPLLVDERTSEQMRSGLGCVDRTRGRGETERSLGGMAGYNK